MVLSQFTSAAVVYSSSDAHLNLVLTPAATVIKVGDTATLNATLSNLQNSSIPNVCFGIEGFPTSGFITTITPECVDLQAHETFVASLNVTATPAAAPQNLTALIVASSGSLSTQAFLSVTVVPAISPLIPWAMILAFVGVITITMFYGSRRKRTRRRRSR
jgi:uncharacterized membrane protein